MIGKEGKERKEFTLRMGMIMKISREKLTEQFSQATMWM